MTSPVPATVEAFEGGELGAPVLNYGDEGAVEDARGEVGAREHDELRKRHHACSERWPDLCVEIVTRIGGHERIVR